MFPDPPLQVGRWKLLTLLINPLLFHRVWANVRHVYLVAACAPRSFAHAWAPGPRAFKLKSYVQRGRGAALDGLAARLDSPLEHETPKTVRPPYRNRCL